MLRRSGGGVPEFGVPAKYHSEARTLCGVSVGRGSLTPMSGNGSLFSSMSATSLLGGVFRNERPETISVKQAEARGMTARLFASLFCHGGACSMAAKPLFLSKVFSKKPKSIIQKGNFEKTFATIFNFFSRFEFSQNEACAYRKGASVRKYVDDRHGWSCVCGRVPYCASAFRSGMRSFCTGIICRRSFTSSIFAVRRRAYEVPDGIGALPIMPRVFSI